MLKAKSTNMLAEPVLRNPSVVLLVTIRLVEVRFPSVNRFYCIDLFSLID